MSSKISLSDMPKSDHEKKYTHDESFRIFPSCPEEEIVISGVSGRYPSSDNVDEFRHNLYNKVRFSILCDLICVKCMQLRSLFFFHPIGFGDELIE